MELIEEADYKVRGDEFDPNINSPVLLLLAPILIVAHTFIASLLGIPILQYIFVTSLTAFLVNYLAIIRTNELYPYLP